MPKRQPSSRSPIKPPMTVKEPVSPKIPSLGSPEFKKLQNTWYKRLKSTGFEDVEDNTNGMLKTWDSQWFQVRFKRSGIGYEAKRLYYYRAAQWLDSFKFKTARDKKVWGMHASGVQTTDIAKKIKLTRSQTQGIVSRLRTIFLSEHS